MLIIFAGNKLIECQRIIIIFKMLLDHTDHKSLKRQSKNTCQPFFHRYMTLLILLLLIIGCAKIGVPEGGLKDTVPPEFTESDPPQRETNFDSKNIEITFNEYIRLQNIYNELIISPPLERRPTIVVRDKSIRISLNNDLLPGTTYTINFGNAVVDINEGNLLPDFEYVFSTGEEIDSLSVTGKVKDAFTHSVYSDDEILVMLFENLADSAPLLETPLYIGRVNKFGLFSINNLPSKTFKVIALIDQDGDMLYDPEQEYIAFMDSLVEVNPSTVEQVTFIKDTVRAIYLPKKTGRKNNRQSDTLQADTVITSARQLNALNIELDYFLEKTKRFYIVDEKRESREKLQLFFNRKPYESFVPVPVNFNPDSDWYIEEPSVTGDTITYWITDTTLIKKDSIEFVVTYVTTDSVNNFIDKTDTLIFSYRSLPQRTNVRRRDQASEQPQDEAEQVLNITSTIISRGILDLNGHINLLASGPVETINADSIQLFSMTDTAFVSTGFTCYKDSLFIRKIHLESNWEEDMIYRLILKPGAVKSFYGVNNDSIDIGFNTRRENYYSRVLLHINSSHYPLIIQLLDSRQAISRSEVIHQPGTIIFDYLQPGKYRLKAIYDKNGNNEWDTGDYLKQIQPEEVFFYNLPNTLRSDWDHDITWTIME